MLSGLPSLNARLPGKSRLAALANIAIMADLPVSRPQINGSSTFQIWFDELPPPSEAEISARNVLAADSLFCVPTEPPLRRRLVSVASRAALRS